jgi:hypothetical protein
MAGILDYNKNLFSTQQFRESLLGRNLPPPVNDTLTQSGLVSKLQDIGNVINVPIFGTADENIPVHYDEEARLFPLGTFFRTTQNVNLNPYIPQNDEYITYELTIPPNLGYPLPEGFGDKVRTSYPTSYSSDRYFLINKGDKKGVAFPFNVIDTYKSLNFQRESSLGLVGGQQLEKTIIDKIAQIEDEANPSTDSTGYITEPVGNMVDNYVNRLRGNDQFFNTLPNAAIGWNEYNSSNKVNGGNGDAEEGVEPTMSTEIRMNTLLERTSVDQVQFTFNLLNRNKYRPLYEDRRLQGTENEGTNSRYYIGTEKNTNRGSTVTKTFDSSDFNGEPDPNGGGTRTTIEGVGEPFGEPNKFFWTTGGEQNFNPNTLLYKTQQLVNNNQDDVFINQTKKFFKDKKQDKLISRGNAISPLALIDASANGNYCRVWTVNDRYNYLRAIRNTGLFTSENGTKGFSSTEITKEKSVLLDSGIPKYHPTIEDSKTERKKFMLSLENLAWADNLADLPLSEIGPGDPLSENKGRIMWFPPYDLSFDENVSSNWTTTEFIGRSEPVYTYNNTKRSGSLSFKILVDHPRVINGYRGKSNDLIERFMAGCVSPRDFLESLDDSVSQTDKEEIKKKLNQKKKQKATVTDTPSLNGTPVNFTDGTADPGAITSNANEIKSFLEQQSTNTNSKVRVNLNGWVLTTTAEEFDKNPKSLSRSYAKKVKELLELELSGLDNKLLKNIKYDTKGNDGLSVGPGDRVDVEIIADAANSDAAQPKKEVINDPTGTLSPEEVKLIDNLIIDESAYFDFIDGNYPNYFKTISEKIKYFQPGYHSITPEGLNSRLTFLQQCMRQGPSIYDRTTVKDGVEVGVQPQNLSFGRPPICILRIGDFFYTKIAINSLSITYEGGSGIQWDLNPEGIGVQPMIASVQLSIDLIGGHSLSGPLNRLQNALSFNYYANTEVYDVRSDRIIDGELKEGIKLGEVKKAFASGKLDELNASFKEDVEKDETAENENSGDEQDEGKEGIIKIDISSEKTDDAKIEITVVGGTLPSQTPVSDKPDSANDKNKLSTKLKSKKEDKDDELNQEKISYSIKDFKVASIEKLGNIKTEISEKEGELKQKQIDFINETNSNVKKNIKKDIKTLEKAIKDLNNDYDKEISDNGNEIKVEAYFTKDKNKTRVKQTFTISEDGIN